MYDIERRVVSSVNIDRVKQGKNILNHSVAKLRFNIMINNATKRIYDALNFRTKYFYGVYVICVDEINRRIFYIYKQDSCHIPTEVGKSVRKQYSSMGLNSKGTNWK